MSIFYAAVILPLRTSIAFKSVILPLRTSTGFKCKYKMLYTRSFNTSSVSCLRCNILSHNKTNKTYPSWYYENPRAARMKQMRIQLLFVIYIIMAVIGFGYIRVRQYYAPETNKSEGRNRKLPSYTELEVAAQPNWTIYNNGIYDLSSYIDNHPGGSESIRLAGGTSLEPYWDQYKFHKSPETLELLETMRIGNLALGDAKPKRCNPPKNVPKVNPEDYRLIFTAAQNDIVKEFKLKDLKNFSRHSIVSAIPCKSNEKQPEATSAPTWTGARLSDVLKHLGIKKEDYDELKFECMDSNESGEPYGTTIPIEKAIDPNVQILLAYEMNNSEIPVEHGYPIRVVMPELAGGKNVKWLSKIVLSKKEQKS